MSDEYAYARSYILEQIPGYNADYEIVHYDEWASYEEHAYMFILRFNGQLYSLEYQYSVMSNDNNEYWDPTLITEDDAIDLISQWDDLHDKCDHRQY